MKRILIAAVFLLLIMPVSSASGGSVSFGVFYSSLGSYGDWIQCDGGVYAWRPVGVAAGWRPYFNGQWCWTDDGWFWASNEPWAWATYHYGRWYYDDYYGWVWVPGYEWAPAWVEWRYGGDYVGWAPLSPYAIFSFSFGIHYRSYWITPHSWWSFVNCRHIGDPNIGRYVYRNDDNTRYIGRTRSAGSVRSDGGRIVSRGPDRGYVERRGDVRLERAEIRDVNDHRADRLVREDGRERIEIYRPRIVEDRSPDAAENRPGKVRESDRRISFDTRNMDIRARDVDRESGRDIRRAEEYRTQSDTRARTKRNTGSGRSSLGDIDRQRQVERGGSNGPERRRESPAYDSRRPPRQQENREVQRERQSSPRPERKIETRRREESRSSTIRERRSSRSVPSHSAPHQETRGRDSGSRNGGRKR
jgi:Family of unknown function (DUF6600)